MEGEQNNIYASKYTLIKTDIQEEERPTDGQIYMCSKYFYWVRLNVKLVWFVIETIKVKSENYIFPQI